jgi:uncharacterized Zn finger protein
VDDEKTGRMHVHASSGASPHHFYQAGCYIRTGGPFLLCRFRNRLRPARFDLKARSTMTEIHLTEEEIRARADPEVYRRGQDYRRRGAVADLVWRGDEVSARVEGSRGEPYRVRLLLKGGRAEEATCDCPYEWGGWCKHVVAVALALAEAGPELDRQPALPELLAPYDAPALRGLVAFLCAHHPGLDVEVETWTALQAASTADAAGRVDPAPVRKRVRQILRSLDRMRPSEAYWHVGGVVEEVRGVLDEIRGVLDSGAARDALALLEALTAAYVEGWTDLDDSDGEAGAFFDELGQVWTEAVIAADLRPDEGERWAEKLHAWQDEVGDYGVDEAFYPALVAAGGAVDAAAGYDDGYEDDEDGADEGEPFALRWAYVQVDEARLNVLERQGRLDEFLALARKTGRYDRLLPRLVDVGRAEEAMRLAPQVLERPADVLVLALRLVQQGCVAEGLDVGAWGLGLGAGHDRYVLARWLREAAAEQGRPDLARQAAAEVFRWIPALDAYLAVRALAGDGWPEERDALLAHLRSDYRRAASPGGIDVLLHEGLVDDAVAVTQAGGLRHEDLRRVADAALPLRPDWVLDTARHEAETIMDAGSAGAYDAAADWLRRARDAYRALGREADWAAYRSALITKHRRKYRLRPLIERL